MIYGIGTDICALSRIADILHKKHANRFIARILTEQEIAAFNQLQGHRRVEYLAGRFALKEALSKALGTGIGGTVGFLDINIANMENGKPICTLSAQCYSKLNLSSDQLSIHISISHEKEHALAFVVIERN